MKFVTVLKGSTGKLSRFNVDWEHGKKPEISLLYLSGLAKHRLYHCAIALPKFAPWILGQRQQ